MYPSITCSELGCVCDIENGSYFSSRWLPESLRWSRETSLNRIPLAYYLGSPRMDVPFGVESVTKVAIFEPLVGYKSTSAHLYT
jgi:hypothetical protein